MGWQDAPLAEPTAKSAPPAPPAPETGDTHVAPPQEPTGPIAEQPSAAANSPPAVAATAPPQTVPAAGWQSAPLAPVKSKFEGKAIDYRTGAPSGVRERIGSGSAADRLANLQLYAPDAEAVANGNFVFTHPETGKPTLANPPGPDVGDIFAIARDITVGAGAALGAAAGTLLEPVGGTIAGAGLGGAGAGQLYDIVSGTTGRVDTSTTAERFATAGEDFVVNAAGQKAGEVISAGAKAAFRNSESQVARLLEAYQRLGIQPTAAEVSGSRTTARIYMGAEASPFGAGVVQNQARRVLAETTEAARRIEQQIAEARSPDPITGAVLPAGPDAKALTPQGAGEVMRDATANRLVVFRDTEEKLYESAFNKIGALTPVFPSQAMALRLQLQNELMMAEGSQTRIIGPALKQLDFLASDAGYLSGGRLTGNIGGVPFQAIRNIRTAIGKDIELSEIPGSTSVQNPYLKRLYAALTEDMSNAAQRASPAGAAELKQADRYVRMFANTTMETLSKVQRFQTDERAFDFAMSASQDGGTALGRLRKSFSEEEWGIVSASVFRQLGLARAGAQNAAGDAFSPQVFLNNWAKLAPEAKTALFGGKQFEALGGALDDLVAVAGSMRSVAAENNHPNSGKVMWTLQSLAALGSGMEGLLHGNLSALGAAGAIVVPPPAAAALLGSPMFVRWLATPVAKAGSIPAHIARLANIAVDQPHLQEPIRQYLRALSGVPEPGPAVAPPLSDDAKPQKAIKAGASAPPVP